MMTFKEHLFVERSLNSLGNLFFSRQTKIVWYTNGTRKRCEPGESTWWKSLNALHFSTQQHIDFWHIYFFLCFYSHLSIPKSSKRLFKSSKTTPMWGWLAQGIREKIEPKNSLSFSFVSLFSSLLYLYSHVFSVMCLKTNLLSVIPANRSVLSICSIFILIEYCS